MGAGLGHAAREENQGVFTYFVNMSMEIESVAPIVSALGTTGEYALNDGGAPPVMHHHPRPPKTNWCIRSANWRLVLLYYLI